VNNLDQIECREKNVRTNHDIAPTQTMIQLSPGFFVGRAIYVAAKLELPI
jgi:hypothetical protein